MGILNVKLLLLLATCTAHDGPIIGILTVPSDHGCETARALTLPLGRSSCFASLYVKYVEAAGGRAVPIFYDSSNAELDRVFQSVNGILFTGGGVDIAGAAAGQSTGEALQYLRAASHLFNLTLAANDRGTYMPLWGTCMGLQTLSVVSAGCNASVLQTGAFDSENMSLPLELTTESAQSRLLGDLSPKLLQWLTTENLTSNLHHDGVSPDTFASNHRLQELFLVLSTNRDRTGRPFVSTIEGRRYPIFAVQWHPERPIFEWDADEGGINHGSHAVESMQYFANFLIAEARKNNHGFSSADEEESALMYNYLPQGKSSYQVYVFPPASEMSSLVV